MPCYRCGTRQVDPDRGESPWRRGVRGDKQVLICPPCQVSIDWTRELDGCQVCGSVHLVRRLGEVECRECGAVGLPAQPDPGGVAGLGDSHLAEASLADGDLADRAMAGGTVTEAAVAELADEVERALAKVLGPSRQRPPYAMS
jgi:hypothetical protein